ncbi:amino acid adenylation domain-containing protein [Amycolatopsis sp. EV170708-02-1]|uniref:non-ribosomal peptide synthetase n=1 Tax=Amycolatopsis sp. EV170708-02-1 TaxID=2919322 RepID=UPI001F0CB173|nr:non-ribosomal peptide synthetase [Amycolatopsis sp. EV170708-02-1]UMP06749.1 non-ribosomal peptide synthetase [Amycolatopsis sp. EV170708-02-1]
MDSAVSEIGACVPQLFEQRVRTCPDAIATSDQDGYLTYAELNAAANRLAAALIERGATADGIVGVNLPRGRNLVTAVLAVLKSGAGYLPLDPALPAARRAYQLAAAGASLLIGNQSHGGFDALDPSAPELAGHSAENPAVVVAPGDLAYVIFTSGSTGQPKPVAVTHASLAHHATTICAAFDLTDADSVLQFAGPGFDVFGEEVYPTLLAGARLSIAPDPMPSPTELEEHLHRNQVTVANLPTQYWDQWVHDLEADPRALPATLRLLIVGSDTAYTHTLADWWRHCTVPVFNAYGLTETTITVTLGRFYSQSLPDTDTLPIGEPLAGAQVHLLDGELEPVSTGCPGELYIGGAFLARGYLGQPVSTAERFVPDPFTTAPGARLYRTGDLAVRRPDGALVFLGRVDDQVKIRGQRVEPAEIATALCTHLQVRQAYVRAVDDEAVGKTLVAYVVGTTIEPDRLRRFLAERLHPTMVPAGYVCLDRLPITANGKIDNNALPAPRLALAIASPEPKAAAPDNLEEQIATIWRELLGLEQVGFDDSFFEVGGHSLLLVQVQRKLTSLLGHQVPGVALFAFPTIRKLAGHLRQVQPHQPMPLSTHEREYQRTDGRARMRQRRARQTAGGIE